MRRPETRNGYLLHPYKDKTDVLACCKHCCGTDNVLSEVCYSMLILYLQVALPGFIE